MRCGALARHARNFKISIHDQADENKTCARRLHSLIKWFSHLEEPDPWQQSLDLVHHSVEGPTYLWLAGNEGTDKDMETTIMGSIGITIRIHSFFPSQLKTLNPKTLNPKPKP